MIVRAHRHPRKVYRRCSLSVFWSVAVSLSVGCASPRTGAEATGNRVSPRLAKAQAYLAQKDYSAALVACVDLARENPSLPGLSELQAQILAALTEERAQRIATQSAQTPRRMDLDAEAHQTLPATYGLRRPVEGAIASLRTPSSPMERVLSKKVTVHLDGVSLNDFILAVGSAENINIIADDAVLSRNQTNPPTMTLHAENVPLSEILDYVCRNMGLALYVGENTLWVTSGSGSQGASSVPMETRLYRLRKGLTTDELEDTSGRIKIIEAIERFVPQEPGSGALFEKKSHTLIVRNTRPNLAKIEQIIESMDVCPPQVLIEARFISTSISDLQELGIDWILNSPIALTKTSVIQNGMRTRAAETQLDATAPLPAIGFPAFPHQAQGLNLSYQGILTDPMFKAVLHALETSGKATTLSVPRITTVNNRPATIRIGEDFRYFEQYDVQSVPSSVTPGGAQMYSTVLVPVGTPQLEELGIQLEVTPSVGADLQSVSLRIIPEISEFQRYETYEIAAGAGTGTTPPSGQTITNNMAIVRLPIFRRSRIETEMIVRSGETVVMGGLITSSESRTENRVPILSSIPIIGRLFRRDGVEIRRSNLLIFVTATILSERGETLIPVTPTAGPAGAS